jgi:hypothetical protein
MRFLLFILLLISLTACSRKSSLHRSSTEIHEKYDSVRHAKIVPRDSSHRLIKETFDSTFRIPADSVSIEVTVSDSTPTEIEVESESIKLEVRYDPIKRKLTSKATKKQQDVKIAINRTIEEESHKTIEASESSQLTKELDKKEKTKDKQVVKKSVPLPIWIGFSLIIIILIFAIIHRFRPTLLNAWKFLKGG